MPLSPDSFRRAEYEADTLLLDRCTWCGRGVEDVCFRANGNLICPRCAERAASAFPTNDRATFWRSVAWGFASAVALGLVLFVGMTQFERFGFDWLLIPASLGIGYAIARAMLRASHGAAGRRYQIAAALLTYAAVTVAFSAATMPPSGAPVWTYPFLVFAPIIQLFAGPYKDALFEFFIAGIGIRWSWAILRSWAPKIVGPESLKVPAVERSEQA